MTTPIFRTNWNRSVHSTPQSPPMATYKPVKGTITKMQIASAVRSLTPMTTLTMLIMALVTQPRIKQFISSPMYTARNPRRNAAGFPEYRISANCTSVSSPDRRQSRANRKTVIIPDNRNDHHSQLPAMPCVYTRPVTSSGVSAEKVVATIDVPANHHETDRPETKYSSMLLPERPRK